MEQNAGLAKHRQPAGWTLAVQSLACILASGVGRKLEVERLREIVKNTLSNQRA